MRRKITSEFIDYLVEFAKDKTIDELLPIVNERFNETYSKKELQGFLIKHKIPYKYTLKSRSHPNREEYPIGAEYKRPDGMVLVKIGKRKWVYKQRYIYEQHHKVKLKPNEHVIFLDQDKANYSIDNLKVVTARQSGTYATFKRNHGIEFNDKQYVELELAVSSLMIKTKDCKKEYKFY